MPLGINGVGHVVKLYFKKDKLSRRQIAIVNLLLHETLRKKVEGGTVFAVLDVPRSKLYAEASPDRSLLPLLRGEAASFKEIWDSI